MHPACGPAHTRPGLELADVVRAHGEAFVQTRVLRPEQRAALRDIERCRTPVLGGHLDVCTACGHERPSYNSCRNRHCPKCQSLAQARWIDKRLERILPVHYFHVVFTLPAELRAVAQRHRDRVFDMLFWHFAARALGRSATQVVLMRDAARAPCARCRTTTKARRRASRWWRVRRRDLARRTRGRSSRVLRREGRPARSEVRKRDGSTRRSTSFETANYRTTASRVATRSVGRARGGGARVAASHEPRAHPVTSASPLRRA